MATLHSVYLYKEHLLKAFHDHMILLNVYLGNHKALVNGIYYLEWWYIYCAVSP